MRQRLWENWRQFIAEDEDLEERTRASKEGVVLPTSVEKLRQYGEKHDDRDPQYFIQMADLNKFGINPTSPYDTPLGLYTYPLNAHILRQYAQGKLPFGQDRKYMHVVRPKPEKNVLVSLGDENNGGLSDVEYDKMLNKLASDEFAEKFKHLSAVRRINTNLRDLRHGSARKLQPELKQSLYKDNVTQFAGWTKNHQSIEMFDRMVEAYLTYPFKEVPPFEELYTLTKPRHHRTGGSGTTMNRQNYDYVLKQLKEFDSAIEAEAKADSPLSRRAAEDASDADLMKMSNLVPTYQRARNEARFKHNLGIFWNLTRKLADEKPIQWRKLLVALGVDGVVDASGEGIIHPSERVQAVFFDKAVVDHLDTIVNTETPEGISRREAGKTTLKVIDRLKRLYKELTGEELRRKEAKLDAFEARDKVHKIWEPPSGVSDAMPVFNDFFQAWVDDQKVKFERRDLLSNNPRRDFDRSTVRGLTHAEEEIEKLLLQGWYNRSFYEQNAKLKKELYALADDDGFLPTDEAKELWRDFNRELEIANDDYVEGVHVPAQAIKKFKEIQAGLKDVVKDVKEHSDVSYLKY